MSNSLKEAFLNLASSLGHCQENSRSIVDVLKRGCSDLAENAEGGGGGGSSDYYTTEHVVGKWIDNTDLYEIYIPTNSTITITQQTWTSIIETPVNDVDFILDALIVLGDGSGTRGGFARINEGYLQVWYPATIDTKGVNITYHKTV